MNLFKNKRGQPTGIGLGTILALILGVGAVIVVILFVKGFFDKSKSVVESLPGDLAFMEEVCGLYVQQNNLAGYCADFKEIGKSSWVNCDYIKDTYKVKFKDLDCSDGDQEDQAAKVDKNVAAKCKELSWSLDSEDYNKVRVNGVLCKNVLKNPVKN